MALKGLEKVGGTEMVDYSKHLGAKPILSMTTVEKTIKGKPVAVGASSETQEVHPGVFTKKISGMSIAVEGGRTLNLGNYESARIGVTITVPCEADTLNEAYTYASTWVSDRIEECVKDAKGV